MAIVKMKHLRVVAMQQDREALLTELQRLGCVEIQPLELDAADFTAMGLSRPDGDSLAAARQRHSAADHALTVLKKYATEKEGMFLPRPELSEAELFSPEQKDAALTTAQLIHDAERQITTLHAQQSKLTAQKATLAPWLALDLPLDTPSTGEMLVQLGTMSAAAPFDAVVSAVSAVSELAELSRISSDSNLHYLLLLCHRSAQDDVLNVLKEFGWSRANLREWSGTARENDAAIDRELEQSAAEIAHLNEHLAAMGGARRELRQLFDRTNQDLAREEARARLSDTKTAFAFEGWVTEEQCGQMGEILDRYGCAWETRAPAPEEYPKVPVKLKNGFFSQPLNMVTEMYSLPAYGGIDPNPLMAPFFILFYGIMLADAGYGLLMLLGSLFVLKKAKPKGGMYNFAMLIAMCGVSTIAVGLMTGGFFGDFIPQLLKLINPESTFVWFWKPLFTPLDDTIMVLIGSIVLGCIQIITGMIVDFVKKTKDGHLMDAIWDDGTWWVIFAGGAMAILGVGSVGGVPVVLILGLVMLVVGSTRNAKGFGKVTALIGAVYNGVTGYFSDIMSYSRLMALMLAGAVVAQVFNTIGAITGNIVTFVIISVIGNALNLALNLLGCFVHDLRLQCLEYFNRFYQDGGKPFRPLNFNTKYVDIKE